MFPGNQSYEEGPKQFVLVLLKKYEKNIQKTVLLGILQIIGFFVKIHCFFVLSGVLY